MCLKGVSLKSESFSWIPRAVLERWRKNRRGVILPPPTPVKIGLIKVTGALAARLLPSEVQQIKLLPWGDTIPRISEARTDKKPILTLFDMGEAMMAP